MLTTMQFFPLLLKQHNSSNFYEQNNTILLTFIYNNNTILKTFFYNIKIIIITFYKKNNTILKLFSLIYI